MPDFPRIPEPARVRTRTGTKTAVTVALTAGLILSAAAAAVGVAQLQRQGSLSAGRSPQEATARVERAPQDVQVVQLRDASGAPGTLRVSFVPSVDIEPSTVAVLTFPSGMNASAAVATFSGNVPGTVVTQASVSEVRLDRQKARTTLAASSAAVTITLRDVVVKEGTDVTRVQLRLERPLPAATTGTGRVPKVEEANQEPVTPIAAGPTAGLTSLRLQQPSGDTVLEVGQTVAISWVAKGDEASLIDLLYTADGGRYTKIAQGVRVGDGPYLWTVPKAAVSRKGGIRLQGYTADGELLQSDSPHPLTIIAAEESESTEEEKPQASAFLDLVEPHGGEMVKVGSTLRIAWDVQAQLVPRVHLYYSFNGKEYEVLATYLAAKEGQYLWKVPAEFAGKRVLFRIAGPVTGEREVVEDIAAGWVTVSSMGPEKEETKTESGEKASTKTESGGTEEETSGAGTPTLGTGTGSGGETVTSGDGGGTASDTSASEETRTTTVVSGGGGGGSFGGGGGGGGGYYAPSTSSPDLGPGRLLKMQCPALVTDVNHPCRAVYYVTNDGIRHAFPNSKVYFSWFDNFDDVVEVSSRELQNYRVGSNATYRPGYVMVKFQTLNTVYAVTRNGVLRAIESEELAQSLYGTAWNQKVHDISDAFYNNYTFGAPIFGSDQYSPTAERSSLDGLWQNF